MSGKAKKILRCTYAQFRKKVRRGDGPLDFPFTIGNAVRDALLMGARFVWGRVDLHVSRGEVHGSDLLPSLLVERLKGDRLEALRRVHPSISIRVGTP